MGIQVSNLYKAFGSPKQDILKNISFEIKDGEFISITGRSGSGKSTLLYLISSLDLPTTGTIKIDENDISKMSDVDLHKFRNEKMGFIFQFHYLLPELTAIENVLMPARRKKFEIEKKGKAIELLKHFGLESKVNNLPSQLSGGEQQRVAVARALIMNPRYLFADEPTGNLDSISGNTVLELLKEASKKFGATVIMVTHDKEYASRADRKINLIDGMLE